MASEIPTFQEVIRSHVFDVLEDVRTCTVASVVSYDHANNRATVQPLIRHAYYDEAGDRKTERAAAIPSVPVFFNGIGKNRITFPVKSGDIVLVLFADRSLDKWKPHGGEVDPGDDRMHCYSDAIAIAGAFDFAHVPTDAPTDAIVIHGDKIRLGSPAASTAVALTTDITDILVDVLTTSAVVTAMIAAVGGTVGDAGVSWKAAIGTAFALKTLGARKVVAE